MLGELQNHKHKQSAADLLIQKKSYKNLTTILFIILLFFSIVRLTDLPMRYGPILRTQAGFLSRLLCFETGSFSEAEPESVARLFIVVYLFTKSLHCRAGQPSRSTKVTREDVIQH